MGTQLAVLSEFKDLGRSLFDCAVLFCGDDLAQLLAVFVK